MLGSRMNTGDAYLYTLITEQAGQVFYAEAAQAPPAYSGAACLAAFASSDHNQRGALSLVDSRI
jgi:hypothetical protein